MQLEELSPDGFFKFLAGTAYKKVLGPFALALAGAGTRSHPRWVLHGLRAGITYAGLNPL